MLPCLSLQWPCFINNESEAEKGQCISKVLSEYAAGLLQIPGCSESSAHPMSVFQSL